MIRYSTVVTLTEAEAKDGTLQRRLDEVTANRLSRQVAGVTTTVGSTVVVVTVAHEGIGMS